MPIEIEELVIRARITEKNIPQHKEQLKVQKQELLEECVAEVMRILRMKNQP